MLVDWDEVKKFPDFSELINFYINKFNDDPSNELMTDNYTLSNPHFFDWFFYGLSSFHPQFLENLRVIDVILPCRIGERPVIAYFYKFLETLPKITKLKLWRLSHWDIHHFEVYLNGEHSLKELILENLQIFPSAHLFNTLKSLSITIDNDHFFKCEQKERFSQDFSEFLSNNHFVKKLSLHNIIDKSINFNGFMMILKTDDTIKYLNLSGNKLSHSNCIAIADLLSTNSSLRYLDLSDCEFNDKKSDVIVSALQNNLSLEEIILDNNIISPETLSKLNRIMESNYSLMYVGIKSDTIRYEVMVASSIDKFCERNKNIKLEYRFKRTKPVMYEQAVTNNI